MTQAPLGENGDANIHKNHSHPAGGNWQADGSVLRAPR